VQIQPAPLRPAPLRHVPALDGLRGVAVAGVLLFHADHLLGGFLGVDLFFTLSGFLITTILLQEVVRTGGVRLGTFWARRARRLLPALFALLVAVALYAAVFARPDELGAIRSDAFATIGYVANWHSIVSGHGYWDLFAAPSPFRHTWSLAIEEQFYVVWPLVVLAVAWSVRSARRRPPVMLGVSLALAAASSLWMAALYRPGHDPQRVYLGTDTRVASILLGAALASLVLWRGPVRAMSARWLLEAVAIVSALTLAWAWVTVDGGDTMLYRGGFALFALCAVSVIATVTHPVMGPVGRTLSFAPLRWLGLISYGLYLWHWPVYLVLTPVRTGIDGWLLVAVRITVSIAIAVASYFCVEMPIRRGAWAGWRIRALTPAVAILAVLAVVVATFGAVSRTSASTRARQAAAAPLSSSAAPGSVRVLVAGDSVAYHLGESFTRLDAELGFSTANVAFDGCALERGATAARYFDGSDVPLDGQDCTADWADAVARFDPDVVVVVLAGQVLGDWQVGGNWVHLCDPSYDAWYAQQIVDGAAILASRGAHVVLVAPPPSTLPWGPAALNERIGCLGSVERALARAHPTLATIDLAALVCPRRECRDTIDGARLRPDGLHFEGPGADVVTRWMAPRVRARARPQGPTPTTSRGQTAPS
jgi:peptidoglycan/LPS O-acetylase OafA/YrhL